jgi:hypothetical protein
MIGFIGGRTADHWPATPLDGDPRPAGVVVDHVAHSYEYLAHWMQEVLADREPVISGEIVDRLNVEHAAAGLLSPADTVAHLDRSGNVIIQLSAGLGQPILTRGTAGSGGSPRSPSGTPTRTAPTSRQRSPPRPERGYARTRRAGGGAAAGQTPAPGAG